MHRFIGFMLAAVFFVTSQAAEWQWPADLTEASSVEHATLLEELHAPALAGEMGIPVTDLHWQAEGIDVHLISGAIFPEKTVQGIPVGAYFEGEATVTVVLDERAARDNMKRILSMETLDAVPIKYAYFNTMRGSSLPAQLGLTAEPSVPLADAQIYEEIKSTMAQRGKRLLHEFLNRDGRCKDTAHVIFAPDFIRATGSRSAYLRYSFEPNWQEELRLSIFGNKDYSSNALFRFHFSTFAKANSEKMNSVHAADAKMYSTELSVGLGMYSAEESTTIRFVPAAGLHAMSLDLNPRMAVSSVTGADGEALPFLQWKHMDNYPNYDPSVLVAFPEMLTKGEETEITVTSAGSLFEPWGNIHYLMDEDDWHPQVNDADSALFEIFFSVPRKRMAVASGDLISDEIHDGKRRYHFRTPHPVYATTMYFGDFKVKSEKADKTAVEVYVDADDLDEIKNQKFTLTEICNIVKFYNQRLIPLETPSLRVTSTPTSHGRGFAGIILISEHGFGGDLSSSDTFRAHEVAHQWWGNMVEPERWPEDRWLSESFADFMAFEYYKERYDKPERLREQMHNQWTQFYIEPFDATIKNAAGERVSSTLKTIPLSNGGRNVYSKGPAILHMLRYVFQVAKGNDDAFWTMLQDFLAKNAHSRVHTEDFTRHASEHMGKSLDWFWNQWLYGTEIPEVTWSHTVEPADTGWLLTVQAKQDTEFTVVIPIYVHFSGNRTLIRPMVMEGQQGLKRLKLPEKPANVTLNNFYESLVRLKN